MDKPSIDTPLGRKWYEYVHGLELENKRLKETATEFQSLRGELATIFDPVVLHHGMTWVGTMLLRIGERLAAYEDDVDRLRKRTHEIQEKESKRYADLERLHRDANMMLDVVEATRKAGGDWFWDEAKVAERPLHLSQYEAQAYGVLVKQRNTAQKENATLHQTIHEQGNQLVGMESRIDKLTEQLPEEMEHCTIRYLKCVHGHGWLTATNWVQHGCPTCEIGTLRVALEAMQNRVDRRGDAP